MEHDTSIIRKTLTKLSKNNFRALDVSQKYKEKTSVSTICLDLQPRRT